MKKQLYLICFLSLILALISTQNTLAQEAIPQKDDFEKMSFEVRLNKSEYLLLEPVSVEFKFSNQTNEPLKVVSPEYTSDIRIKSVFNGKTNYYNDLFGFSINQLRIPRVFQPGESVEEIGIIKEQVGRIFPEPGNYEIQFILKGNGTEKTSTVNLVIKEPMGINKEAFDYLKAFKKENGGGSLFSWSGKINAQRRKELLQEFVDKYSESEYGEYAILSLGNHYLYYENNLEKADAEFEKLKSSENLVLAKQANKSLADTARKKAGLEKERQKQPQ